MLACVCQPADPGIFRRSPIPLGAPPLKFNHKGAIPKPGRTLRIPVITNEPGSVLSCNNNNRTVQKTKRRNLNDSDKRARKCNVTANNKFNIENSSAAIITVDSDGEHGKDQKQLIGGVKEIDRSEREEITVDEPKESSGSTNLKSADKKPIRKLNDFEKV